MELNKLLEAKDYKKFKIYHYCSLDYKKQANAAYLMGAFQVICLKKSAKEAYSPFENYDPPFTDFRDAIKGACTFKCTVKH